MKKVLTEELRRLVSLLPDSPGCYLMKDEAGKIIYVGKAKSLKKRVSQYFLRDQVGKVAAMVSHVARFDTIRVSSDKEAFILEMNLIKQYVPRYNVMLVDDSHYPYIALSKKDARLSIERRADKKGKFYFGPFPSSHEAYLTIDLLNSLYPTRKCDSLPTRACLYYHMGLCLAPCINKVDEKAYEELYAKIKSFLDGNVQEVVSDLTSKMEKAAARLDYEEAGRYKKTIDAVRNTVSKQTVEVDSDRTDRDVYAYKTREGYLSIARLTYRKGRLLGKKSYVVPLMGEPNEEATYHILSFYESEPLPTEVPSGKSIPRGRASTRRKGGSSTRSPSPPSTPKAPSTTISRPRGRARKAMPSYLPSGSSSISRPPPGSSFSTTPTSRARKRSRAKWPSSTPPRPSGSTGSSSSPTRRPGMTSPR